MVEEIKNTENATKPEAKTVVEVEQPTGPKVFTVESILLKKIFHSIRLINCLFDE